VREKRAPRPAASRRSAAKEKDKEQDRTQEALELILETLQALIAERGSEERVWGSMIKQALKRRSPGFNESYYGFDSFSELLEEARTRELLGLERDEKSGGYLVRLPERASQGPSQRP
jgi:hypothetical protein